jgi:hypothetical protein
MHLPLQRLHKVLMALLRDHYEGTPFDLTQGRGRSSVKFCLASHYTLVVFISSLHTLGVAAGPFHNPTRYVLLNLLMLIILITLRTRSILSVACYVIGILCLGMRVARVV